MKIVNEQLHEYKIKLIQDYQEKQVEGELMKLQMKKALEDEEKQKKILEKKKQEQRKEYIESNKRLMEYKEIQKQKEIIEDKKLPETEIKNIALQLTSALFYLHSNIQYIILQIVKLKIYIF